MGEENSLVFQAQESDIDSEEEDDIIRKHELQKLLSEQLQDDLLDTSNEEEEKDGDNMIDNNNELLLDESGVYAYHPHNMGTEESPLEQFNIHATDYHSNGCSLQGRDNFLPRQSPQQHMEMIHPPSNEVSEVSNVFNGTSQEYSQMMDTQQNQLEAAVTISGDGQGLHHLSRQQLELLYVAKTRQIKELENEVKRTIKEEEKKCGIMRHQVKLLEDEKQLLLQQSAGFKEDITVLQSKLSELENQKDNFEKADRENEELKEQLFSSRVTINSLTVQLNELSNTEVLQKIRQNYESVISLENKNHLQNINELKLKVASLEKQLEDVQSDNVKLMAEIERKSSVPSCTYTSSGMCEKVVEIEKEKRRVIGELEDLTFQLNSTQEELVVYQEKVNQLEHNLHQCEAIYHEEIESKIKEQEKLQTTLDDLRSEYLSLKNNMESNLKRNLENCRSACLKLHEDSTMKLKQEFVDEKQKIEAQYRVEIDKLRRSNVIIGDKERKDNESVLQKKIDIALCAAHLAWKEDEKKRREEHIQKVLMKAREDHQKHLAVVLKEREKEWIVKYNKTNSADGLSRRKYEKISSELTKVLQSLQDAIVNLVTQTISLCEEEKKKEIHLVREKVLKEAEVHYLSCLSELVSNK